MGKVSELHGDLSVISELIKNQIKHNQVMYNKCDRFGLRLVFKHRIDALESLALEIEASGIELPGYYDVPVADAANEQNINNVVKSIQGDTKKVDYAWCDGVCDD